MRVYLIYLFLIAATVLFHGFLFLLLPTTTNERWSHRLLTSLLGWAILWSVQYGCAQVHAEEIPHNQWTVAVDNQDLAKRGAATNAFDGKRSTAWRTQRSSPLPHQILINVGAVYDMIEFRYLPPRSASGRIGQYELYVSVDGANWGNPVAVGTFANDSKEKIILFAKRGQFVLFRALSEVRGRKTISVPELKVIGTVPPPNQAPDGVIDSPASDITITVGGVVNFAGTGTDPDNNQPLSFRWTFGGSGAGDATVEDPGAVQFNVPGTFTVTFAVTDGLGLADPTPATRTITVQPGSEPGPVTVIPRDGWTIHFVDNEVDNAPATQAIDGDPVTFWRTEDGAPLPHELQINMGGVHNVSGFRYLPRQDSSNGWIRNYEFYVSTDGVNWGNPVVKATFAADASEKEVLFAAKQGQYVRLRVLTVQQSTTAAVAELNVLIGGSFGFSVAIGDSITAGEKDDIASDNTSNDGRNSGGGYPPILNNLLTAASGVPQTVENAGVGGDTSSDGLSLIGGLLAAHTTAQRFLVLYGMNDARPMMPVPSGLGLNPGNPGYPGTYKDNMQQIIDAIEGAGKEVAVAKVNIALGDCSDPANCGTYPDPVTGARSVLIQQYNQVIDELKASNGLTVVPPDFFAYFRQTYPTEYSDNIHPNGIGYQSIARLWCQALTQNAACAGGQ